MGFLKKFAVGLLGAVLLFVVVAFFLPREVAVSREALINAPPEKVFAYVNDLKKFNEWSPWATRDPNMKQTYSGPASGVGQKVAWQSDHDQVGSGTQEIVASDPNKSVKTALDFGDMRIGPNPSSASLIDATILETVSLRRNRSCPTTAYTG